MNLSQNKFYPLLLSVLSGLIFSCSWHPFGFPFLLFIAFVPLFFLEEIYFQNRAGAGKLKVFGYSYISFLIWNVGTTWWIYNSSAGGAFFAFTANALFMALVFTLFNFIHLRSGQRAYFIFPVLWVAFEYLHINWDLSWPWLTLGNGFAGFYKWIQWYEYTGVLGGSLWVLAVNISVLFLIKKIQRDGFSMQQDLIERIPRSLRRKPISPVRIAIACVLIFILMPVLISKRMYNSVHEKGKEVSAVIVQPNVDPYNEKFTGTSIDQMNKMLSLASGKVDEQTDYLILPETAIPEEVEENSLTENPGIMLIRNFTDSHPHTKIICGMSSHKFFGNDEPRTPSSREMRDGSGFYESYNSSFQMDSTNKIPVYHKSKLVLGVEMIPYPKFFKYFEKFTINLGGTSGSLGTQNERTVFKSDAGNVASVICYESVYGDFLREYIRNGADFFAVITNDGWWGDTPGFKQHLAFSQLRAIEFRRDIARSANTGVSCFINQRGDVSQATEYWKPAVIKGSVNLNEEITFYAKHGDYIGIICGFLAVLLSGFYFIKRTS